MQLPSVRQPFDRLNLTVLVLDRESQTGIDALTVHQHGARAARALIAALLRAHQLQAIAQGIQQGHAGIDGQCVDRSIDPKRDVCELVRHWEGLIGHTNE